MKKNIESTIKKIRYVGRTNLGFFEKMGVYITAVLDAENKAVTETENGLVSPFGNREQHLYAATAKKIYSVLGEQHKDKYIQLACLERETAALKEEIAELKAALEKLDNCTFSVRAGEEHLSDGQIQHRRRAEADKRIAEKSKYISLLNDELMKKSKEMVEIRTTLLEELDCVKRMESVLQSHFQLRANQYWKTVFTEKKDIGEAVQPQVEFPSQEGVYMSNFRNKFITDTTEVKTEE